MLIWSKTVYDVLCPVLNLLDLQVTPGPQICLLVQCLAFVFCFALLSNTCTSNLQATKIKAFTCIYRHLAVSRTIVNWRRKRTSYGNFKT